MDELKGLIKSIVPDTILKIYRDYNRRKQRDNQLRAYQGNSVICPICSSKFKAFAPYGRNNRKNALCLNCGSLERHRLIWKYMNETLDFFHTTRNIRLLHFAPESVFYDSLSRMDNIEYLPCDLDPEKYPYQGEIKVQKIDITKIPYKNESFDFILCNHVLEHIPNDKLALAELFRVMKTEGGGIFQVPINYNHEETYEDFNLTTAERRISAFGQHDHVRVYGRDYKDKLAGVGFNVTADEFVKGFTSEELQKFGINSSELIYYCQK